MARHPPDLKRGSAKRDPKRRFIIYCEGMNTEPGYFTDLGRKYKNALITIETHKGTGVPLTIARKAADYIKKHKSSKNSFEKDDQVWAVFDRDAHPDYEQALDLCNSNGVKVGRSDPCFELWLILHIEGYDKPDGRDEVQRHLRKLRPDYDHKSSKTLDYSSLLDQLDEAEKRAERQLDRRAKEGKPDGRPSTTIFQLTRAIYAAAQGFAIRK